MSALSFVWLLFKMQNKNYFCNGKLANLFYIQLLPLFFLLPTMTLIRQDPTSFSVMLYDSITFIFLDLSASYTILVSYSELTMGHFQVYSTYSTRAAGVLSMWHPGRHSV
jgi:hypothetical protein